MVESGLVLLLPEVEVELVPSLWPCLVLLRFIRARRELCCLEVFPAALLSSAPREWWLYLDVCASFSKHL